MQFAKRNSITQLFLDIFENFQNSFKKSATPGKYQSKIVNFISDIRIYSYKKIQLSVTEINIEIKTTATAIIKYGLKYFLMSEGNTCIAAKPMIQ